MYTQTPYFWFVYKCMQLVDVRVRDSETLDTVSLHSNSFRLTRQFLFFISSNLVAHFSGWGPKLLRTGQGS